MYCLKSTYPADFACNLDNAVAQRVETNNVGATSVAVTHFSYDNRQRLTQEVRAVGGQITYDLTYTYDQLGNRQTRFEAVAGLHVSYYYDTDYSDPNDPVFGGFYTRNNRLLKYEVRFGGANGPLLRTVKYTYYKTGDVSNITLKDEYVNAQLTPGDEADYAWYHDLMLHPYMNNTVGMARASRWRLDGQGQPADFAYDWARQFAYDPDPRARYLDREVEPAGPDFERLGDEHWTDYLGGTGVSPIDVLPWGDLKASFDGQGNLLNATDTVLYLGTAATQDAANPAEKRYLHGDLIDSTVLLSDQGGTGVSPVAYSAFGEILNAARMGARASIVVAYSAFGEILNAGGNPGGGSGGPPGQIPAGFPRYQYAGGWGYESPAGDAAGGGGGGGGGGFPGAPGGLTLAGVNPNLPPITLIRSSSTRKS